MKPNKPQFPDANAHDMPEGVDYSWTSESQQEMSDHYERERMKLPYMSENAQDIENSKRSRGERL